MQEYLDFSGITAYRMEKDLGKSKNYWGNTKNPTAEFITLFLDKYRNVSAEWLLRGEGDMLTTQEDSVNGSNDTIREIHHPKYKEKTFKDEIITLYDIEAAANLKTLLAARGEYILGKITIPNAPKCDGALYVRGDSMYPLLKSGDIVAYKEITPNLQNIFWGEMYVVDMCVDGDDYLVVKYVQRSEKGEDWVKLVSHNQDYQPKDFLVSSIRAMALVKLSIRMNTIK